MANSRKTTTKPGTVTEFPAPDGGVAVADVPEPAAETTETPETPPAPPKPPGRTKKENASPEGDFFQQVASVRPTDWGTRVYLYLYQLEPVCDLKKSGGKAYLMRYEEPITDEHRVMLEQGSGRYRFILAKNKVSADASNELARYEFEIFNRNYPPKLAREAWVPDPRNRRWEALLPAAAPPPTAANTIVEAMKVVSDIRQTVRDELPEPVQPVDQARSTLETMKLAKELFAPAPAAPAAPVKDPLELAVSLFQTISEQKANNPMVDFLTKQMDRQHEELMAMRKELQESRKAPENQPKSLLDQIFEMAGDDSKMERIKKVAGMFGFGMGEAARTTALDVAREIVNSPFGANLGQGLGSLLTQLAAPSNGAPGQPAQSLRPVPPNAAGAQPGVTHETDQQRIQRIAGAITRPMIDEFFDKGESGTVWAERVFDLWPRDLEFLRSLGADTIVNLYQQYDPALWQHITVNNGNREPQFRQFMTEFLAWRDESEEAEPPEPAAPGATATADDDDFGKGATA